MAIKLKHVFKSFLPVRWKEQDNHKHHHNPKLKPDVHDQEVMSIINLMPLEEFDDGIDESAFLIDPKLLSGFLGPELGGAISNISNDFDFGFEAGG